MVAECVKKNFNSIFTKYETLNIYFTSINVCLKTFFEFVLCNTLQTQKNNIKHQINSGIITYYTVIE